MIIYCIRNVILIFVMIRVLETMIQAAYCKSQVHEIRQELFYTISIIFDKIFLLTINKHTMYQHEACL